MRRDFMPASRRRCKSEGRAVSGPAFFFKVFYLRTEFRGAISNHIAKMEVVVGDAGDMVFICPAS